MSWSPNQYVRFEAERTRAARDLLAGVPNADAKHAVDLGCGPGNSTELLARRFPGASIFGVDSSAEMIDVARKRLPGVAFTVAAIDDWRAVEPCDVIFANAALHWVPRHERVFPRMAAALGAGGTLAVQMPDNLDEPSHVLMREVAAEGPWATKLSSALTARTVLGEPSWYYDILRPACTRIDIWRTTYHHVVDGVDAIVEWFKGSGLRPFLGVLDAAETRDYLGRYTNALKGAYPAQADGKVLLRFPRLFIVATR